VCSRTLARASPLLDAMIFGPAPGNKLEPTTGPVPVLRLAADSPDAFRDLLEILHSGSGPRVSATTPDGRPAAGPESVMVVGYLPPPLRRVGKLLWLSNKYACSAAMRARARQWRLDLRPRDPRAGATRYHAWEGIGGGGSRFGGGDGLDGGAIDEVFVPLQIAFELGEVDTAWAWVRELVTTYSGAATGRGEALLRWLNTPMTPFDFRSECYSSVRLFADTSADSPFLHSRHPACARGAAPRRVDGLHGHRDVLASRVDAGPRALRRRVHGRAQPVAWARLQDARRAPGVAGPEARVPRARRVAARPPRRGRRREPAHARRPRGV
jgi:hypothetical protein